MNEMKDKLSCETLEMLEKMIEEVNKKANITPSELTALKEAYELRMELQECYGGIEIGVMLSLRYACSKFPRYTSSLVSGIRLCKGHPTTIPPRLIAD